MPQQDKERRPALFLRWLLPLLVTAAAVYFLGRQIDFSQVGKAFTQISAANLLLVLALFGLSLILRVICWFFLLEGKFSFSEAFFGMNAGYLLNNVLPFKLGEFGRAALLAGRGKSGFLQVFASIVTERVLDFFLAAFFFLISLPLVVTNTSVKTLAVVILALTVLGMLAAALAARNSSSIGLPYSTRDEQTAFVSSSARFSVCCRFQDIASPGVSLPAVVLAPLGVFDGGSLGWPRGSCRDQCGGEFLWTSAARLQCCAHCTEAWAFTKPLMSLLLTFWGWINPPR
jgi:hypothetical protein